MQSRVGIAEDEEFMDQASDSFNGEGQGSTSSWMQYLANPGVSTAFLENVGFGAFASSADFFSTSLVNHTVKDMALAPPQIASSSQAHVVVHNQMPILVPTQEPEEVLNMFCSMAHGVSRNEAMDILIQFNWDLNMALNQFFEKRGPKNKRLPLPIPQRELSSKLKATILKGNGKATMETTASEQKATLKGKGKAKAVVETMETTSKLKRKADVLETSPASLEAKLRVCKILSTCTMEMEDMMKCLADEHIAAELVRGCFSENHEDSFRWFGCYNICIQYFPSNLAIKLLEVYIRHNDLRFKALQLLTFSLSISMRPLSPYVLVEIQPLLIECLNEQSYRHLFEIEREFNFLKRIVSSVMDLVFSYKLPWDELADCLCVLAKSVPSLALCLFLHLPPSMGFGFISRMRFCNGLYQQASLILSYSARHRTEDVIDAFSTLMYIGVQLTGQGITSDFRSLLVAISNATRTLLDVGQTETLCQALGKIRSILALAFGRYGYFRSQKNFLFDFAGRMIVFHVPMEVQMALLNLFQVFL